jgi:hypothetical protein
MMAAGFAADFLQEVITTASRNWRFDGVLLDEGSFQLCFDV